MWWIGASGPVERRDQMLASCFEFVLHPAKILCLQVLPCTGFHIICVHNDDRDVMTTLLGLPCNALQKSDEDRISAGTMRTLTVTRLAFEMRHDLLEWLGSSVLQRWRREREVLKAVSDDLINGQGTGWRTMKPAMLFDGCSVLCGL
jgi:hypothetical protein